MNLTLSTRRAPELRTELPGPNAARLIAEDDRYLSPSYTRSYPLVVERAAGAVVEDVDGNRFLDFTAGIAVCATGHCHPRVVAAVREQAGKLLHMSGTDFHYRPQIALAKRLAELAPGPDPKRVFFTNSGTESVEAAMKLARHHTGRSQFVAFFGAFHGRTLGSLSLTASKTIQREGFGPLLPGVTHLPFPDPYRANSARGTADACAETLDRLENELFRRTLPPRDVAAIVVEPIQGEGGYIVPPADFHRRLQAIAVRHGILYVVDEVQSGMGRTGRMFASEHFGIEPDILCLAKGIASGLPLGAIVAKGDVMNWKPGAHASTFGGNPVACVAALETIDLLEEELIANAEEVGAYLLEGLRPLAERHPLVGDVRGKGLMIGIELVRDRVTKERAVSERDRVVEACFRRGLLVLGCGPNSIRLSPPLIIDRDDADAAIAILDEALGSLAHEH